MVLDRTALLEAVDKCEAENAVAIGSNPELLSKLDDVLRDVREVLRPKPEDREHRKRLVVSTEEMVKGIFGKCSRPPNMEPFGSFTMNLFTARSDLDLSVNFNDGSISSLSRYEKIGILKQINKFLISSQRQGSVRNVTPILSARVPIIKFVDKNSGVECDLSVENKDGVLKSSIIYLFSSIDARFEVLSFLMKVWANAQDINSSKDHTLNSLSVILLVVLHLQTQNPPILPPLSALLEGGTDIAMVKDAVKKFKNFGRDNSQTVAELFISLLNRLYSVKTLWKEGLCASVYKGCWISKEWQSKAPPCIHVEDFTDRSQNCARAVIPKTFRKIYLRIHKALVQLRSFMEGTVDKTRFKMLLFGPMSMNAGESVEPISKKMIKKKIKKMIKKKIRKPKIQRLLDSAESKAALVEEKNQQLMPSSTNGNQSMRSEAYLKEAAPSQTPVVGSKRSQTLASATEPSEKKIRPALPPHHATNTRPLVRSPRLFHPAGPSNPSQFVWQTSTPFHPRHPTALVGNDLHSQILQESIFPLLMSAPQYPPVQIPAAIPFGHAPHSFLPPTHNRHHTHGYHELSAPQARHESIDHLYAQYHNSHQPARFYPQYPYPDGASHQPTWIHPQYPYTDLSDPALRNSQNVYSPMGYNMAPSAPRRSGDHYRRR